MAGVYPWPAEDGYRQRLSQMVAGLGEAGEVDFLCIGSVPADEERAAGRGCGPSDSSQPRRRRSERTLGWLRTGLPRAQLSIDVSAGVEDEARAWTRRSRLRPRLLQPHPRLAAVPGPGRLPGDRRLRQPRPPRHPSGPSRSGPPAPGWSRQAKWLALQPVDRIDEGRMQRLAARVRGGGRGGDAVQPARRRARR